IEGSAIATFLAVAIYNTVKLIFVNNKFKIQPFSFASVKILLILIAFSLGFYFWDFPLHPIINIAMKSLLIGVLYFWVIHKLNISEDISQQIKKYLKL
ncbi:MAG: sugar isomerase, partial [Flavobacteriaceae bacterium]|nr:sugar isomerase [Flavobacteriaceae bacterium]